MIQSGTDLADFLPKRLAWGIVIVVLLGIAIFALPNINFGSTQELNLANRKTYKLMIGMNKTEILQKFGSPKSSDQAKNELTYNMPGTGSSMPFDFSTWVVISFDANDRCTNYSILD
jgi:hypothetical protein